MDAQKPKLLWYKLSSIVRFTMHLNADNLDKACTKKTKYSVHFRLMYGSCTNAVTFGTVYVGQILKNQASNH